MQKVMQLLMDIGLPNDVVNVVHGEKEVVEAWYDHDDCRCLLGGLYSNSEKYCTRLWSPRYVNDVIGRCENHLVAMEDAPLVMREWWPLH